MKNHEESWGIMNNLEGSWTIMRDQKTHEGWRVMRDNDIA